MMASVHVMGGEVSNLKRKEKSKHVKDVRPEVYDAVLKGIYSFKTTNNVYSDGDWIKYVEVDTSIGVSPRPPLIRQLKRV